MLSLSCKAAIKAVILIGSRFETGKKTGIKEIAKLINESEHTVGKLLQKLVKHKIINSSKGPSGGFFITNKQKKLPIVHIVVAVDGKNVFNQCGLGLSKCSETHPCPFHNDFKPIRNLFFKSCSKNRIIDLYQNVNDGLAYLI